MKKLQLILGVFMLLGIASCSKSTVCWIDNPTDQPVEISIDGSGVIVVKPKEFLKMKDALVLGEEHTMSVNGGDEIKFTIEQDSVMLNPTKTTYVVSEREYGKGVRSKENDQLVDIEGQKYYGAISQVSNDVVIYLGSVDYHVNEVFDRSIASLKRGTKVKSKIFRIDDFKVYYAREYDSMRVRTIEALEPFRDSTKAKSQTEPLAID